jgi:hypothetical protein
MAARRSEGMDLMTRGTGQDEEIATVIGYDTKACMNQVYR